MEEFENIEKKNPNNIGKLLGFKSGDVETFPNRGIGVCAIGQLSMI